ncbi:MULTISPECIES: hypothetical protein [Edwardsiella]|uniref:DUF551 domain-containing protein n=1 Tax=Edwardsiella anguillarum TaxID=1821960 RepID=A0ABY8SB09_9GAMM|nr:MULTISPECIES: hypothetical protein [Edwardsiella]UBU94661.1 DUF551 domain-containing protein [Edwardsiella sp. LADL05-105]UOU78175.1 DUF551 domain-containing protein [Edwardsiella anguillarum]WHP82941.1 DUF551 domain-containing protein [Edwardsiella anguillarum]WHP86738.1 DUF551 domain-containing protein [Edwardsiella anguillarum]WHP90537.1 DUF551 domain-containing protein [Edwardsiella anguillarum]
MTTITKEQLIKLLQHRISVAAKYPDIEEAQIDATVFKIALASVEADPVAYVDPVAFHNFSAYRSGKTDNKHMGREWMWANPDAGLIPVYTVPPAPVSDPAVSDNSIHDLFLRAKSLMYQSGGSPIENSLNPVDAWLFEAERADMLQAEPISPDAEEPDDTVFTCPRCGRRSSRPNGEHYCHPLAAAARETAPKEETSNG